MKTILALGPFIGDFEQEVITFRPYAKWLSNVFDYEELFLSIHHNRTFLYNDFIKKENIIPIFTELSKDVSKQLGFIHSEVSLKEYKVLIKNFKEKIVERGYKKKDIENIYISYRKTLVQYPVHNKIFTKIKIKDKYILEEFKDKYLILSKDINECLLNKILDEFGNTVVIINTDMYSNNLEYLFSSIFNTCKGIITTLGFWTLIANLQSIPVFSWGDEVSMFRKNGIYNFDNKNCVILPKINDDMLIDNMKLFIL